jgi:hypothetical protein
MKNKLVSKCEGAYSAGLAAKKGAVYAKDSVDFIITVQKAGSIHGIDDDIIVPWGFEAKARVKTNTINREQVAVRTMRNPHIRIDCMDVINEVSDPAERFQVLHHAYVYDFETVVLAIGDNQGHLIRSTIIDFNDEIKTSFGEVLKKLKTIGLDWVYRET